MKKIFTRSLCICMAAALIINIAVVALLQIVVMEHTHTQSSNERLEAVKETLIQNEENIAELTKAVGENNLAKTRAFADLLAADQSILEDQNKMNAVKDRLMVNELHVIDEKGTITHSTVENYIGFDMNSGEQSAAFMPIASDPSIEIVQEPTVNAAEGIVMQYIGVARKDAPGLVQVGIRPEVLENMLSNAIRYAGKQIDVMSDYDADSREWILTVRDDGPGFSEEQLDKALRPYYKETEDGGPDDHFGIGLHICRELCKKHGGTLNVANSIRGGAVVTASFLAGAPAEP